MSAAPTSSSMTWGAGCSKPISRSPAAALALRRTVTDVAAVVDPGPMHAAGERVGLTLRGGDARTQADRAQHPSTVGEYPAGLAPGTGMEDLPGELCRPFESLDDVALAHALRIARRRHDDAECRAPVPLGARPVEAPGERRLAQRGEIGVEAHQDR